LKFNEFSFCPELLQGIDAMGYDEATPIQVAAIPIILQGKDLLASAQTGTGKTAAFLLPIIEKIMESKNNGQIQALIIVPTRELAVQIDQNMEALSYFTHVNSIAVYGGSAADTFSREQKALSEGADVVICTPGRMIAHLIMGYVKISSLQYLVLDEADRMLDMGFHEDIARIISYLPAKRQNLMFSATMPVKIKQLAKKILTDQEELSLALSKPAERVLQAAYLLFDHQKIAFIEYLLTRKENKSVLVFCGTKEKTKQLCRALRKAGLKADEIHSDLDQPSRERVLMAFKNKSLNILVATDIMSRGIDVEDIDIVINYDVPRDGEDYIHRIGRTARAASDGLAFTLVNEKDQANLARIEELLGKAVYKDKVPEEFGPTPAYAPKKRQKFKR
jgi:superfamily II DNA/RNA helicase